MQNVLFRFKFNGFTFLRFFNGNVFSLYTWVLAVQMRIIFAILTSFPVQTKLSIKAAYEIFTS